MRNLLALVAVGMLCLVSLGADEPKPAATPKSPSAVAALKECEKSVEVAEKACRDAKAAAEHKLVDKLKIAEVAATKAGNLPEANAIDAQIKEALARIDELNGKSSSKQVAKYILWQVKWNGGGMHYWLKADGTSVNQEGLKGKWEKHGSTFVIDWGGPKDTFVLADDGKTLMGKNQGGNPLAASIVGTSDSGAELPPK